MKDLEDLDLDLPQARRRPEAAVSEEEEACVGIRGAGRHFQETVDSSSKRLFRLKVYYTLAYQGILYYLYYIYC